MIPHWTRMYSWWIKNEQLCGLSWSNETIEGIEIGRSSKISGLMIYVALSMMCEQKKGSYCCKITYSKISELTGLSRKLVSAGLSFLQVINLITVLKEGRNNYYTITTPDVRFGWCKIPVRKIMSEEGDRIIPFYNFSLRNKVEFHAVKLFLYLASVRDNHSPFSTASYEKISKSTGISINDISKAKSFLIASGLLDRVDQDYDIKMNRSTANQYYLAGYTGFFKQSGR